MYSKLSTYRMYVCMYVHTYIVFSYVDIPQRNS